jgi:hypothetical protein
MTKLSTTFRCIQTKSDIFLPSIFLSNNLSVSHPGKSGQIAGIARQIKLAIQCWYNLFCEKVKAAHPTGLVVPVVRDQHQSPKLA